MHGYGQGYYGMHDWGWDGMLFHGAFWLVALVLLVIGVVLLIRLFSDSGRRGGHGRSGAFAILEERFARGEIDREEFVQRRRDLQG